MGKIETFKAIQDAEISIEKSVVIIEKKLQQILTNTPPKLKQLPKHLCYEFLGENFTFLVIVATSIIPKEEKKLLGVLRERRTTLG